MQDKGYANYSICDKPTDNKLLHWFFNHFYKKYIIEKNIKGTKYICEYYRSPFWAYEKPTLRLFFSDKINTWHGQVWEVFPKGGRCGFGSICFTAMFPKKHMKKFLDRESRFVWNACNKRDE